MSDHVHRYEATIAWAGSTVTGHEGYDRDHTATVPGIDGSLPLTADPSFRGDPAKLNPEVLLLVAASSCQLLTFLAVAAKSRVDVVAYEDRSEAAMPEDDRPVRITTITLRPRITVAGDVAEDRVRHLVEVAHKACFIANSVSCEMTIDPEIVRA